MLIGRKYITEQREEYASGASIQRLMGKYGYKNLLQTVQVLLISKCNVKHRESQNACCIENHGAKNCRGTCR